MSVWAQIGTAQRGAAPRQRRTTRAVCVGVYIVGYTMVFSSVVPALGLSLPGNIAPIIIRVLGQAVDVRWATSVYSHTTWSHNPAGILRGRRLYVLTIFSAIDWIAAHWEPYSFFASKTIRIARSLTSSENLLFFFTMTPSSHKILSPVKPVRFSTAESAFGGVRCLCLYGRYLYISWSISLSIYLCIYYINLVCHDFESVEIVSGVIHNWFGCGQ